jgi:hypothetical protein
MRAVYPYRSQCTVRTSSNVLPTWSRDARSLPAWRALLAGLGMVLLFSGPGTASAPALPAGAAPRQAWARSAARVSVAPRPLHVEVAQSRLGARQRSAEREPGAQWKVHSAPQCPEMDSSRGTRAESAQLRTICLRPDLRKALAEMAAALHGGARVARVREREEGSAWPPGARRTYGDP